MNGTVGKDRLLEAILDGPVLDEWSVHCETYHDKEVLGRIELHGELATDLAFALSKVSKWRDDGRHSAGECGKTAYRQLMCLAETALDLLSQDDAARMCEEYLDHCEWGREDENDAPVA